MFRRYFVATLAVVCVLLLALVAYKLKTVALLVAIAGLLAYLLAWPIEHMSNRWPRWAAVSVVFTSFVIILVGLFGAFVPILTDELQDLIASVPGLFDKLEARMHTWQIVFPNGQVIDFSDYLANITDQLAAGTPDIIANAFDLTQSVVSGTATLIGALLIVPMITLYFLLDSKRLRESLISLFAKRMQPDVGIAIDAVNRSLGSYIYSRVLLGLFVGTSTTAILLLFGVKYAVLLGLLAFVGEFIPVIGPTVLAYCPIALIILLTGTPATWFWVTLLFVLIQLIENYGIAPKLIGDTMNLHPLTVILAMLIGGTLGGVAGLLVAIPAAAALKVIFGMFIFRKEQPGIDIPKLDVIGGSNGEKY